jgi:putative transposase
MSKNLHRRSIRLKSYDYAQMGAYFVTICTHKRECSLSVVTDGSIILSLYGQIVEECWQKLPRDFEFIDLDEFVVMPNHFHGIVVIRDIANLTGRGEAFVGEDKGLSLAASGSGMSGALPTNASPLPPGDPPRGTKPRSLAAIVQNFKSITTRRINTLRRASGAPFWQRNYYEHVVRGDADLNALRLYIAENAMKWELDQLYSGDFSQR